jgi:hypothetical protein
MGSIESTSKDPAKIYTAKIKDKVMLLDNPLKSSEEKKKRTILKKKVKTMSAKEKRQTRIYEIPKECHK